ncbi:MAG: LamG domain-containing protein [Bacteroidales bacterium]|nr:LamG domain-containing protein [Bacteroidales bacterium]
MKARTVLIYLFLSPFALMSQNYCLRFFGNGQNDIDRVKIALDSPHKSIDVGESFTIEFQLKATAVENPLGANATEGHNDDWTLGHVIIDRDIFGPGDHGDYGISLAGGRIAFGVNNGSQSYTLISNTILTDGIWHHVAVTRRHTNGEMNIFIDGILDKSFISGITGDISYRDNRTTQWPNDPYLVIGAEKHDYDNSTYPSFSGMLDEIRISNKVRYHSNYTPQLMLTCDSITIALYHLDEGQGLLINDACNPNQTDLQGTIYYGGNPAGPVWMIKDFTPTHLANQTQKIDSFYFSVNPFLGEMIFSNAPNKEILFFDSSGKLILAQKQKKINIQHLHPGIYLVKFDDVAITFVKTF